MAVTGTHFTFRVDLWTPDGESIVEHIAGVEDYQVALATFRAACERWPRTPITLRQASRTAGACAWLGLTRGAQAGAEVLCRLRTPLPSVLHHGLQANRYNGRSHVG